MAAVAVIPSPAAATACSVYPLNLTLRQPGQQKSPGSQSQESGQLITCLGTDFHRGAGVLDVFYETPSTLLSCGYDTYIRYWDLRASTKECVKKWEEPHDSALYCIRSNGNHMIASGSSYYGVVRLWDKRQTRCLQSFSLSSPISSPVYCLRFSTTHLYATVASALYVLDFTTS
ncbi:putative F-box-WD repeat-containing protein [Naja naja]|nr:putative F-box-WD repeat-containing protein [Naja naja]